MGRLLAFLILASLIASGCLDSTSENRRDAVETPATHGKEPATNTEVMIPEIDGSKHYTEVDARQAKRIYDEVEGVVVVDVRGWPLYDAGHIPGAINIPEKEVEGLGSLDKEATYLIYCGGNGQSIRVGEEMGRRGFKNVYRLVDGYAAWRREGYPKEKT
ncbi:MAG: hypothetical protein GF416_04630 [Candidatus Altiarchaeales archaeon]|nr:hypothetical protein [Candidatus Altiarchaeales archaeon]MBD3416406.1 hypothetical protein [Candidatus Altiarchaeales archaeon]